MPNKSGITTYGFKEAEAAQKSIADFIRGSARSLWGTLNTLVGDDLSDYVKRALMRRGQSNKRGRRVGLQSPKNARARSVGFTSTKKNAFVYYDPSIAAHGPQREWGGIISAFRSKFKIRGIPQLFISLVPDARPVDWKNLIQGIHYVLTATVKQTGTMVMWKSIITRLRGGGPSPTLQAKFGLSVEDLHKRKVLI